MPPTDIAFEAKRVDSLFQQLTEAIHQSEPHSEASHGISKSEVSDTFGRYRIWAGNIGAFQHIESKSALAYRIREAPKIAAQIVDLLDDVAESLDDACQIVSNVRENRTAFSPRNAESLEHTERLENPQQESNDGSSEETSEIRELFDSINDVVKNLFRLSIIVRNSTHRDRYARAASAAMAAPFNEQFDIDHVKHKFPRLEKTNKVWLVERLGRSITQRRHYLRYCREHHAKMSKDVNIDGRPKQVLDVQKPPLVTRLASAARTENSNPTSTLAPTQASTLALSLGQPLDEDPVDDNQSQTSYATSTEEDNTSSKLSVAALEEISNGEKFFECPYCWQIQTIRNQKSWKKHVFSDLKPYVCTHEDCDLKMFSDQRTWFAHELDHRRNWRCYFCRGKQIFKNSAKYQHHLESAHPDAFIATQLPTLLDMSRQTISRMSPSDCTLCEDWESQLRAINPHIPTSDSVAVTLDQFQHHVGGHMEQLALFAIPRGNTVDGDADTNGAHQVRSEGVSIDLSLPDSKTASELRLCEEILNEIMSMPESENYKTAPKMPSVSLRLPDWRIPKTLPLDLTTVSRKLETGAYKVADDFTIDVILVFAFSRAAASLEEPQVPLHVEDRFMKLCEQTISKDKFLSTLFLAAKKIRWKWWMPRNIPLEPSSNDPNAVHVTFVVKDDMTASRRFLDTTTFEQLYAFVECHDTIINFPESNFAEVHQPVGYAHEYDFRIHRSASGEVFDVNYGSIGVILGSHPVLSIEIIDESEPQRRSLATNTGLSSVNVLPAIQISDPAKTTYEARKADTGTEHSKDQTLSPIATQLDGSKMAERLIPTRQPVPTYPVTFPDGSLEGHCSDGLTNYASFRVRKAYLPGRKLSWARAEVKENPLDEAYIRDQITKSEFNKSIEEKWAALDELQHKQITTLLGELNSEDMDKNFGWFLAQIGTIESAGETITENLAFDVYVKNAPLPGLDVVALYRQLEQRRDGVLLPLEFDEGPNIQREIVEYRILNEKLIDNEKFFLVLRSHDAREMTEWRSADNLNLNLNLTPRVLQDWETDKEDIRKARRRGKQQENMTSVPDLDSILKLQTLDQSMEPVKERHVVEAAMDPRAVRSDMRSLLGLRRGSSDGAMYQTPPDAPIGESKHENEETGRGTDDDDDADSGGASLTSAEPDKNLEFIQKQTTETPKIENKEETNSLTSAGQPKKGRVVHFDDSHLSSKPQEIKFLGADGEKQVDPAFPATIESIPHSTMDQDSVAHGSLILEEKERAFVLDPSEEAIIEENYHRRMMKKEKALEERASIEEKEIRRRLEVRDRELRKRIPVLENEAVKQRVRERQLPKRRFNVGLDGRRHRVHYDDGVYRWE